MNQKQRDILCGMINGKAKKLKEQLSDMFPLQKLCESSTRFLATSYSGDITRYEVSSKMGEDALRGLPTEWRRKHASLIARRKNLSKQENALNDDWDVLAEVVQKIRLEEKVSAEHADENLTNAVQRAVIKIQFAEDTEQVNAILDSLPSVEQLLESSVEQLLE